MEWYSFCGALLRAPPQSPLLSPPLGGEHGSSFWGRSQLESAGYSLFQAWLHPGSFVSSPRSAIFRVPSPPPPAPANSSRVSLVTRACAPFSRHRPKMPVANPPYSPRVSIISGPNQVTAAMCCFLPGSRQYQNLISVSILQLCLKSTATPPSQVAAAAS